MNKTYFNICAGTVRDIYRKGVRCLRMKFVFYDEMVYIYLFMRWYQKNDELLIFKKSIVSSNTIVIMSSIEMYTKIQSQNV